MRFDQPYSILVSIAGRDRQVTIAPSLLSLWWGKDVGPQTAEGLVSENGETIDELLAVMIAERKIDPASTDEIVLTEDDFTG